MDGALDLKFLKRGSVSKFPDQPDLTQEVRAALQILSRNDNGFVLMVESGLIDLRVGNLPMTTRGGVHSGDDVVLTATGPGAEVFHGHVDNTTVLRAMALALGLGK